MKQHLYHWISIALVFTVLTACNTMKGAGEDIQEAGEKIEETADKYD